MKNSRMCNICTVLFQGVQLTLATEANFKSIQNLFSWFFEQQERIEVGSQSLWRLWFRWVLHVIDFDVTLWQNISSFKPNYLKKMNIRHDGQTKFLNHEIILNNDYLFYFNFLVNEFKLLF